MCIVFSSLAYRYKLYVFKKANETFQEDLDKLIKKSDFGALDEPSWDDGNGTGDDGNFQSVRNFDEISHQQIELTECTPSKASSMKAKLSWEFLERQFAGAGTSEEPSNI